MGSALTETVNEAIREAHIEAQRRHNWRFAETSTSVTVSEGDTTFTLPSDFKQELNPYMSDSDGTGYRRAKKALKDGIEAYNTDDEGRPLLYRIWNGQGVLYGKADQDYTFTLEYYRWFSEITSDDAPSDSDEQDFLDSIHKFMEYRAIEAGFLRVKKYDDAIVFRDLAEGKLLELINDDEGIAMANQDLQMELQG